VTCFVPAHDAIPTIAGAHNCQSPTNYPLPCCSDSLTWPGRCHPLHLSDDDERIHTVFHPNSVTSSARPYIPARLRSTPPSPPPNTDPELPPTRPLQASNSKFSYTIDLVDNSVIHIDLLPGKQLLVDIGFLELNFPQTTRISTSFGQPTQYESRCAIILLRL
jgi:hypothetical protein